MKKIGVKKVQLTFFGMKHMTDFYIGRTGAFEELLNAVNILLEHGIAPRFQLFINQENKEDIVEFIIKRENPSRFYEITDNTHIIDENEYWALEPEEREGFKEIYTIYAITEDEAEYVVDEEILFNEYTELSDDVPYNWVDDYIISEYEYIDDFIEQVNNQLNLRKDLRFNMKDTFYMTCFGGSKSFVVTAQTHKKPYTQTISYHPEKAVENEDYNILDGNSLTAENVDRVEDIKIPTITYKGSIHFGDGSADDTPCLVETDEGTKKPYSVGVMNYAGISIPKDTNNQPFKYVDDGNGGAKYIDWERTQLADLFNFPIIDKIIVVDYIAWSAFVNIPQYGYYKNENNEDVPYKKTVTMNGLLSGIVFNGDAMYIKELNELELLLSDDFANKANTYVEKRAIYGFDYSMIVNSFLSTAKGYIRTHTTRELIEMFYNMFGQPSIIDPNIVSINTFINIITGIVVVNDRISYFENGNEIFGVDVKSVLKYILAFTKYFVNTNDQSNEMQYAFVLPFTTILQLQDRNGCGVLDTIEGDLKVELSNEAVNDCRNGGEKIIKFESDNSMYFSIFKAKVNGNIVYPLNLARQNAMQLWQINDRIDTIYNTVQPQNLFSFQTKTDYLRGRNGLIDTRFESEVLVINDDGQEEYEPTRGYGTTGEFIPTGSFSYPIFVVAETENHVRALSPVYDYSNVLGKVRFGVYHRKDAIIDETTGTYTLNETTDKKFGVAVANSHFYLDNYSYKLSAVCKVDNANTITITEQTLTKANQFAFTTIDDTLYNIIRNKINGFGPVISDIARNTTITAIDYTGLKHICGVENSSFAETEWYTFIWNGNLPLDSGDVPGVNTCGLIDGDEYVYSVENVQEKNDTQINVPEAYISPNYIGTFLGWSENRPDPNNIIQSFNNYTPVNDCHVFFANWDRTLPTRTVTYLDMDGVTVLETQNVTHGQTTQPSVSGDFYVQGDTTKTIVSFPYTVTSDITFVKYNPDEEHTVTWTREMFEVHFLDENNREIED